MAIIDSPRDEVKSNAPSHIETRIYRLKKGDADYYYLYLPSSLMTEEFPFDVAKPLVIRREGSGLVIEQKTSAAPDDNGNLGQNLGASQAATLAGAATAPATGSDGDANIPVVPAQAVYCHYCGFKNSDANFFCDGCRGNLNVTYDLPPSFYQASETLTAFNNFVELAPTTQLVRVFMDKLGTRWVEAQLLGNGVKLGEKQYPSMYRIAKECARIMAIPRMPKIFISSTSPFKSSNLYTLGTNDDPIIIVDSFVAGVATPKELTFLLAREMGHIKCGHPLYMTVGEMARILASGAVGFGVLGPLIDGIPGGVLGSIVVNMPFKAALSAWIRASHYTADRAGVVAVRDMELVKRVFGKLASSWLYKHLYTNINYDELIEQAKELEGSVSRYSEYMPEVNVGPLGAPREFNPGYEVPFTVKRLKALTDYIETSQYALAKRKVESFIKPDVDKPGLPADPVFCGYCGGTVSPQTAMCETCGKALMS